MQLKIKMGKKAVRCQHISRAGPSWCGPNTRPRPGATTCSFVIHNVIVRSQPCYNLFDEVVLAK